MRSAFTAGLLLTALAAGAAAFGIHQASKARYNAFFAERVNYSRHLPPPEQPDNVFSVVEFFPSEIRERLRPVPRNFLATLPEGMAGVGQPGERKRIFIAAMLPLILRVNELIAEDRARLMQIKAKTEDDRRLSRLEREWVVTLAGRYGLEAEKPSDIDMQTLLSRVDIIPPDLALAQGAIESGWGTSRFARLGNAIYGQWTWRETDQGIVPLKRSQGKSHRIKAFDYLMESVRSYAANLNRGGAYAELRRRRAELRGKGETPTGMALAGTLTRYSERGQAYIKDVRTVIASNELAEFNAAQLTERY